MIPSEKGPRAINAAGIFSAMHPFPVAANAVAAALFVVIADASKYFQAALIFFAVGCIHAAIGFMNDVCDERSDRVQGRMKPLVAGAVSRNQLILSAFITSSLGVAFSFALGIFSFALGLSLISAGVIYNLWAKHTVLSWLPYAYAMPLLPVWGSLAGGEFRPTVLLAFPIGSLLAVGLNVANQLSDVEHGGLLEGLAHRLGERGSKQAVWASFASAIAVLFAAQFVVNARIIYPFAQCAGITILFLAITYLCLRQAGGGSTLTILWYGTALLAIWIGGCFVATLL